MNSYLLFKSLHLIAVVSWMAGLLYLPRIFVYHVENKDKREATDIFEVMEKRLFYYIMRPAMILTWVFGLILIHLNQDLIIHVNVKKCTFQIHRNKYTSLFESLMLTIYYRNLTFFSL